MFQEKAAPRLTALAHGGGCGCKLAPNVLRELLAGAPLAIADPAFLVDAASSDDAAVYRLNETQALVATTDFFTPIVDDPFDFGRIAAANALSDVYAMGAKPIFALALVGMPIDKLAPETIRAILAGGRSVAEAAGAPIAGGHSIDAAEPIYGLAAFGLVDPTRVLTNAGARRGDVLILGKSLGVGVFSAAFKQGRLSVEGYAQMIASTTLLNTPGPDLAALNGVHALTDVTGFGLLGHAGELARASGLAIALNPSAISIFDEARDLAKARVVTGASARNWASIADLVTLRSGVDAVTRDLLCDPQTSGGLLAACAPEAVDAVLATFRRHGHLEAHVIGSVERGPAAVVVV